MQIVKPSVTIDGDFDGTEALKKIERIGRVCYKSEDKITDDSYVKFVRGIIARGHESVLEHVSITVRIVCDRGVSHELVRHRVGASYSQESTRYCNYGDSDIKFIQPAGLSADQLYVWRSDMHDAERKYKVLLRLGASAQTARAVLPNSLKTEICVTMNLRAWRHFFALRTDKAAHPQMREVACMAQDLLRAVMPIVFAEAT